MTMTTFLHQHSCQCQAAANPAATTDHNAWTKQPSNPCRCTDTSTSATHCKSAPIPNIHCYHTSNPLSTPPIPVNWPDATIATHLTYGKINIAPTSRPPLPPEPHLQLDTTTNNPCQAAYDPQPKPLQQQTRTIINPPENQQLLVDPTPSLPAITDNHPGWSYPDPPPMTPQSPQSNPTQASHHMAYQPHHSTSTTIFANASEKYWHKLAHSTNHYQSLLSWPHCYHFLHPPHPSPLPTPHTPSGLALPPSSPPPIPHQQFPATITLAFKLEWWPSITLNPESVEPVPWKIKCGSSMLLVRHWLIVL